jgi:triosephosphate isomerase
MQHKPLIAGNWKMHSTRAEAAILCENIVDLLTQHRIDVQGVIFPPATLLHYVHSIVQGRGLQVGAQDCFYEPKGAFTGDLSASMLRDVGCEYAIVGHSERRMYHHETDIMVFRKANAARHAELTPIICVGETQLQREAGETLSVVEAQTLAAIAHGTQGEVVLAYEPVWAIGSGDIPTLEDIAQVHTAIINTLTQQRAIAPEQVRVLYGGSVKPGNAGQIMAIPSVHGLLVGGASLQAESFCAIMEAAAEA